MSHVRYLCLFAHSGVQRILCCVFVLFVFVLCTLCYQFLWIVYFRLPLRYSLTLFILCTLCYQFLWIVYFRLPLRYSLTFIYLVYPILPVSLNCPFLIATSVFSNVCLAKITLNRASTILELKSCLYSFQTIIVRILGSTSSHPSTAYCLMKR